MNEYETWKYVAAASMSIPYGSTVLTDQDDGTNESTTEGFMKTTR